jgi:GNAT superfamily N-acetyltransferase
LQQSRVDKPANWRNNALTPLPLRKIEMPLDIRPAVREDAALILRFITDLAIYEKAEHEVKTDVAGIENSLFADGSSAHGLICELDGEPIGYAVYFFNYSTWLGKHGLYLEDLYVTPQQRGVGAGKALLRYLAKLAVARGCGRFEWSVLDWNQPAIDFYESIGARPQNEWIGYCLTGDALSEFAAG